MDDGGFDGFLETGAEFDGGEGGERVDVAEDGEGVVEGADEVLAGEEVDAGLAAEGGIDLGEERGGQANVADAAHVDGGEEARDVADDAAAEGEEDGVAVGPGESELLGEGLDCGETLVRFAGGEKQGCWLLVAGEGREEAIVPERPDCGRGDDEEAEGLSRCQPAQARVERAQQAGGDGDGVGGGGGGDTNGGHGEVMVSHVSGFGCAMRW